MYLSNTIWKIIWMFHFIIQLHDRFKCHKRCPMIKSIIVQWAKEQANNMNNSWTNMAKLTKIKRRKKSKSQESFAGQQFNAMKLNSYSGKKSICMWKLIVGVWSKYEICLFVKCKLIWTFGGEERERERICLMLMLSTYEKCKKKIKYHNFIFLDSRLSINNKYILNN